MDLTTLVMGTVRYLFGLVPGCLTTLVEIIRAPFLKIKVPPVFLGLIM